MQKMKSIKKIFWGMILEKIFLPVAILFVNLPYNTGPGKMKKQTIMASVIIVVI